MIAKITEVFPMVERNYTDKNGLAQTFKSKGFLFMTSNGSFYGEAVQEWAEHWERQNLKKNHCVDVNPSMRYREYKDANGVTRFSNEVTIANMILL